MGGEEFAVLCRSTDAAGAMFLAERLRGAVAIQPLTVSAGALRATISVGVATFPHPAVTSLGDLLEHADQAMYRAKREGRNRVIAAP
jgi:diguanylate cyclase (GGDEF)-like protein